MGGLPEESWLEARGQADEDQRWGLGHGPLQPYAETQKATCPYQCSGEREWCGGPWQCDAVQTPLTDM